MKTRVVLFTIFTAAVLLGSCVGTNALGVLDESIPQERQCNLEIRNNLSVILYDNQPVKWAPGFTQNKVTITLPSGQHTFLVVYYETETNNLTGFTTTRTIDTKIEQEFISGHSYRIYKQSTWLVFLTITTVKIKDVTPKR